MVAYEVVLNNSKRKDGFFLFFVPVFFYLFFTIAAFNLGAFYIAGFTLVGTLVGFCHLALLEIDYRERAAAPTIYRQIM